MDMDMHEGISRPLRGSREKERPAHFDIICLLVSWSLFYPRPSARISDGLYKTAETTCLHRLRI